MNLTPHFTLEELTASQTALRRGIDNTPTPRVVANLTRVAKLLEQVRKAVGGPVTVSSGYRSRDLNKAVGGAAGSAHVEGLAADILAPGWTPLKLAQTIRAASIEFDQLIYEGTWVHIGLSNSPLRGEVLTAHFDNGSVSYSKGLA